MKKFISISLFSAFSVAALAFYAWPPLFDLRTYTVDEHVGLNCKEIGEKQEEVIFAHHDASIAHYSRTGAFEDDLGLPREEVLPFVILMKKAIQDNGLKGFDLTKPFFHAASVATPRLHSDFYAEISSVCAASPTLDAIKAMVQAAKNLEVMPGSANP